jgi:hypothetical protein
MTAYGVWYLVLGGVAVGRRFEPQCDLELSFAEILTWHGVRALFDWNGCQTYKISQRKRTNINSCKTFISNAKNYKKL